MTIRDSVTTLATCAHEPGPLKNGEGGCCGRWVNDGMCPGVATAAWLNGLGSDSAPYIGEHTLRTNFNVRMNYIANDAHVKALDPSLAAARERVVDLAKRFREAKRELVRLELERGVRK